MSAPFPFQQKQLRIDLCYENNPLPVYVGRGIDFDEWQNVAICKENRSEYFVSLGEGPLMRLLFLERME